MTDAELTNEVMRLRKENTLLKEENSVLKTEMGSMYNKLNGANNLRKASDDLLSIIIEDLAILRAPLPEKLWNAADRLGVALRDSQPDAGLTRALIRNRI